MNNMRHNTHQPLWQLVQNEHELYIMQQSSNKVIPSKQRDESYICDIVELDIAGNPISYTECKTWLWWHDYQHPLHVLQKNIHNHRSELNKGIYKQWRALAHTNRPYCVLLTLYKGKPTELAQSWQGLNALPAQHLICMGQGVQVHIYQVSTLDELTPLYKRYAKVKGAPSHADVITGTLKDRPSFDIQTLFNASMNETIDLVDGADYQSYISRPSDPIKKAKPLPAAEEDQAAGLPLKIKTIGRRYPNDAELKVNALLRDYYLQHKTYDKMQKALINDGYTVCMRDITHRCPSYQFIDMDFSQHKLRIEFIYRKHIKKLINAHVSTTQHLNKFSSLDYNVFNELLATIGQGDSKVSKKWSRNTIARIFKYHYQSKLFSSIKAQAFVPIDKPQDTPQDTPHKTPQQLDLFTVSHERITHLEKQVSELREALNTILMILEEGR